MISVLFIAAVFAFVIWHLITKPAGNNTMYICWGVKRYIIKDGTYIGWYKP